MCGVSVLAKKRCLMFLYLGLPCQRFSAREQPAKESAE